METKHVNSNEMIMQKDMLSQCTHISRQNDLKPAMEAFKATRYFSLCELQPIAGDLDVLCSLTFLKANDISSVNISTYLSAFEDISIDPLEWRQSHEDQLPIWANAFRKLLLVQPSSESLFSPVKLFFKTENVILRQLFMLQ